MKDKKQYVRLHYVYSIEISSSDNNESVIAIVGRNKNGRETRINVRVPDAALEATGWKEPYKGIDTIIYNRRFSDGCSGKVFGSDAGIDYKYQNKIGDTTKGWSTFKLK